MDIDNELVFKFNKHAKDFLNVLIDRLPNEKLSISIDPISKIKNYLAAFIALEAMNTISPLKLFMSHMEEFGLQIMSFNEDFFKQDKYVNGAESISGELGLVQCWESLSIDTKQLIWKYIQALYSLGMGALSKRDKLLEILQQVKNNNESSKKMST